LNAALQGGLASGPAPAQAAALLRRAQCLAEGLVRGASVAADRSAGQTNVSPSLLVL
jgi:hypothetical protein